MGHKNNSTNNPKSLYLYAALIFIVAILLIIIAFFGQSKLEQNQPIPIDSQTTSITERASVLSEENKTLMTQNRELESKLDLNSEKINELNNKIIELEKGHEINNLLISVNGYCSKKMYTEAYDILNTINFETLNEDQIILYNSLKKVIEKGV